VTALKLSTKKILGKNVWWPRPTFCNLSSC